MTQLSGATIWKDNGQFNNDITLVHTHIHTHTHTKCLFLSRGSTITNASDQGLFNCRFKWTNGLGGGGGIPISWTGYSSMSTIWGGPMDKFLSWSWVHNYHLQWISRPSFSEMGLNSCHRTQILMYISELVFHMLLFVNVIFILIYSSWLK